jgi:16S rRNA (uracil1498-N3)-methyltransferase
MNRPWFHLESVPAAGGSALLLKQEARHALGSRRLNSGDQVMLFDGCGGLANATITEHRDQEGNLTVEIQEVHTVQRETPFIELCASLPKGDRLSTMLDMCTQAGMDAFRPLECDRSVIKASNMRLDRTERWGRITLEACKQSARAWQPRLEAPLDPVSAARTALDNGHAVLVAQKGGSPIVEVASDIGETTSIFIGPEGGFSDEELRGLGKIGGRFVSLSRAIYRIETAAIVAVASVKMTDATHSGS